jgi:excisionase family DNA binding protein
MQRKIMNDKLLYRIPEVAEHLSISRSKVYELLKSGELRSVHIDRSRLVRARDLQALATLTSRPAASSGSTTAEPSPIRAQPLVQSLSSEPRGRVRR